MKIIIISNQFPKIWVDYYRKISSRIPVFLRLFLIFTSHVCIFSNLIFTTGSGSFSRSFSLRFWVQSFLRRMKVPNTVYQYIYPVSNNMEQVTNITIITIIINNIKSLNILVSQILMSACITILVQFVPKQMC